MSETNIDVHPINVEEVRTIRQIVLRPGMSPQTCIYPHDDDGTHFGAYLINTLVGIVSYYHQSHPDKFDPKAWRLRGMATLEEYRRIGVGKTLIEIGNKFVKQQGGNSVWCNARKSAVGFYEKFNFNVISEEFEIPLIGPHLVMVCKL